MVLRLTFWGLAGFLVAGLGVAAFLTRDGWLPWLANQAVTQAAGDEHPHEHAHGDRLKLTAQARENLKLVARPARLQTYWRTLQVPGVVIDRPGHSDRGVTAPLAAIVSKIQAFPGDTVKSGEPLFTLRLISEYVQNAQAELFKNTQEIELNQKLVARLKSAGEAVPEARIIEAENQHRRLANLVKAHRQELLTSGLTPEQIDRAATGQFIREVTLLTPEPAAGSQALVVNRPARTAPASPATADYAYEVQELKVQLGQQVLAGQTLATLANHQSLYIEGRGFKKEAPLLEQAAQHSWPMEIEFAEDDGKAWPPLEQTFQVRHLANAVDTASRTFGFYIPLTNQLRTYQKEGQTFLVWRFRPGQRVRLHVPVEKLENVFVLPVEGVAREGPEVYVFRQNGDAFDRKPVHVLFEDRRHVVLANDGSLTPGVHFAQNSAAGLNRILKTQQSAGEGGHSHAGHSHEH